MTAIYKREMLAYFTSPVGYVYIGVFAMLNSFLFSAFTLLQGTSSSISSYFLISMFLFIVLIPLLTMKSFSEERRMRTEQLLLTSPVGLMSIIFAKFLAAFTMFGGSYVLFNLINLSFIYKYGEPNTAKIMGSVIGVLLVGAAFIAIGLFISALTENQMVAAVGTMGAIIFMLMIDMLNSFIGSTAVRELLSWISVMGRFVNFRYGILDFAALLYYFSVCFVFMFLTVRVYEKRRWS